MADEELPPGGAHTGAEAWLEGLPDLTSLRTRWAALDREGRRNEKAALLNPSAGSHPIPDDDLELKAAFQAGAATWLRFPYYAERFGDRGKRFTWSDSAWLTTLSGHSAGAALHHVRWLGHVLAVRGMPQWMLECHLFELHSRLIEVRPEHQERYRVLELAARTLRDDRRSVLTDELLVASDRLFDRSVAEDPLPPLPHSGSLLAAAYADQQLGIGEALPSFVTWLRKARPSKRWDEATTAVLQMLTDGRP